MGAAASTNHTNLLVPDVGVVGTHSAYNWTLRVNNSEERNAESTGLSTEATVGIAVGTSLLFLCSVAAPLLRFWYSRRPYSDCEKADTQRKEQVLYGKGI